MKVLQVSSSDISGGAFRAVHRIHRALLEEGIDSKMIVQQKDSSKRFGDNHKNLLVDPTSIERNILSMLS